MCCHRVFNRKTCFCTNAPPVCTLLICVSHSLWENNVNLVQNWNPKNPFLFSLRVWSRYSACASVGKYTNRGVQNVCVFRKFLPRDVRATVLIMQLKLDLGFLQCCAVSCCASSRTTTTSCLAKRPRRRLSCSKRNAKRRSTTRNGSTCSGKVYRALYSTLVMHSTRIRTSIGFWLPHNRFANRYCCNELCFVLLSSVEYDIRLFIKSESIRFDVQRLLDRGVSENDFSSLMSSRLRSLGCAARTVRSSCSWQTRLKKWKSGSIRSRSTRSCLLVSSCWATMTIKR